MQRFNYQGRWYTLEQYQKLLNPTEEVSTPEFVDVPNETEQTNTVETKTEESKEEVKKSVKKVKKSNKK